MSDSFKKGRLLIPVIGVVIVLFVALLGVHYSDRSQSCELCHSKEARYTNWLIADKAQEGFSHDQIACADCHFEGASERGVSSKIKGLTHTISNLVPLIDPRKPRMVNPVVEGIPSKNCIYCHVSFDKIDEMNEYDLPEDLKEIGLAMGHKKHYETALNECAACHERFKLKDGKLVEDKGVNYKEYSHMTCDSCHKYIAHAYKKFENLTSNITYDEAVQKAWVDLNRNTRWKVDIPSEEDCRRCHNGKIHFQQEIFLADKIKDDNYENCLKCHPSMTRKYFDEYKHKQSVGSEGWKSQSVNPGGLN